MSTTLPEFGGSGTCWVVSGQVGLDLAGDVNKIAELAGTRLGAKLEPFHVGERMYREVPTVERGRILQLPPAHLDSVRRSVFKDAIHMRQRGDNLLIRTHTCFRWHDGLFPAFNFEHMHALKPDGFLVVVDNLDTMYARLKREHEVDHNLIDLAFLREEEIFATQLLSEAVLGPGRCFIVARGRKRERLDNIARLIADPKAKRCYPSIPMTHAMGDPELWEKICEFRSRLAEKLVCFDPVDVDEKNIDYLARDAEKAGHSVIRVTVDDLPFEIPLPEAKAAVKYIDGQIRARDFALIDQAHFIASYIPELKNGLPGLSSGVERELEHARRTGKRMFIVWEPKKLPSPFDDSSPTVVVPNTEALFEALAKHGMIN